MQLGGFIDGEFLFDARLNKTLKGSDGIISATLYQHFSICLKYVGHRCFEELRYQLRVMNIDTDIMIESIVGKNYQYKGEAVEIPLESHAKCPIRFNRLTALGMLRGSCYGLVNEMQILGIPFNFPPDHCAIKLSTSDSPSRVRLDIRRKLKSLYLLHCCEMPVKGYLNSYLFKYQDKIEEVKIIVGDHIGNSQVEYSQPWSGNNGRIAWHNPQDDACLYMMEWQNPYPNKEISELEITWPEQPANVYIVGLTGICQDEK